MLAAHVPELAGRAAAGELDGVERDRRADAGPSAGRQRAERHREPARAGSDARTAGQSARPARSARCCASAAQRATVSLDMFNALNADTVLTYNQAFTPGGAVAGADHVLTARTAKITVQYDF